MREAWINVYADGTMGAFYEFRKKAISAARCQDVKCVYRIKVRLK